MRLLPSIGGQQDRFADAEVRMHDPVPRVWRDHGGIGAMLEPHQGHYFGAERPTIELECFLGGPSKLRYGSTCIALSVLYWGIAVGELSASKADLCDHSPVGCAPEHQVGPRGHDQNFDFEGALVAFA